MANKMKLYEVNNALDDVSLECKLVRTLRIRYENRREARTRLCGTKWIYEAIRELKTFRHNRKVDPARHAKLDTKLMKAREARFLMPTQSLIYIENSRI